MELDQFTKKRVTKELDNIMNEILYNPDKDARTISFGAYCGVRRILILLGIENHANN